MMVAAPTNTVTGAATASRSAALCKPWAFCLFAVRARVRQALATQKHRKVAPTSSGSPQPNSTVIMLVESDIRGGSHGVLP